jgi:DNA-directed RNA polymerase specialized sigma24 family protein
VQETFARVFTRREGLPCDPLRPVLPYLLTVARNVFIDACRVERRHERARTSQDTAEESHSTTEEEVLAISTIRRCLGGVNPFIFAVYRKRFVEDLSQRAAAASLGLSHQKLRTAESALLQMFRSRLRSVEDRCRPL